MVLRVRRVDCESARIYLLKASAGPHSHLHRQARLRLSPSANAGLRYPCPLAKHVSRMARITIRNDSGSCEPTLVCGERHPGDEAARASAAVFQRDTSATTLFDA